MLVLSRKKNERIIVGENIVITVVEIRGDRVRLGIDAPMDIPIHRSEVVESIKAQEAAEKAHVQEVAAPEESAAVSFDRDSSSR